MYYDTKIAQILIDEFNLISGLIGLVDEWNVSEKDDNVKNNSFPSQLVKTWEVEEWFYLGIDEDIEAHQPWIVRGSFCVLSSYCFQHYKR